ncbi:MAG: hypothetical protein JW913_04185 [Chitinispirillaceae bacterium]|nr:hypothetical protein [Chitinispirillaceae bacterium]
MDLNKLSIVAGAVILFSRIALSNSGWDRFRTNFSILPEASFDSDFRLFAFQKNDDFREKYSCETNFNLDLAFLGVKEKFFWMFRSEIRSGCGDSYSGMVLHPYDISFGLIPTLEYRFKRIHVAAGLDHRCFHRIDYDPPESTIYWNKVLVSLNSPHRREHPYVGRFIDSPSWSGFNRLIWSFTWGYYLTEFFGLVETTKLMTPKRPHYLHDFQLTARYGLVRWRWGAVTMTGASLFGVKHSGDGTYWAQETGAEVLFALRPFDSSLFVNYIFDEGRFNSKDRLLEFGVRVVK